MGNSVTLLNDKACSGVIDIEKPMNDQIKGLGMVENEYVGRVHLWCLSDEKMNRAKIFSKVFYNTQLEGDDYRKIHIRRGTMNHPNLLKYFGCTQVDRYKLCSNMSETQWFFEYECLVHSLQNVIQYHRYNYSNIKEMKVWKILGQVISALAYLEKRNEFHSDIQPKHIFIDQQHNIKILEYGLLHQSTGYTQTLIYAQQTYLSPQLMAEYCNRSLHPVHDVHKSDVYALAITILELLTLDNSFNNYNFLLGKINYHLITQQLTRAKELGYSQQLINLLETMLQQDEAIRPSPIQLDESGLVDFQNTSLLNQTQQLSSTPPNQLNKPNDQLTQSTQQYSNLHQQIFATPSIQNQQQSPSPQVQMFTPSIQPTPFQQPRFVFNPHTTPLPNQQYHQHPIPSSYQQSAVPLVQYRQPQQPILHSPQRSQIPQQFNQFEPAIYQLSPAPTRSRYTLYDHNIQQQFDYQK